MSIRNSLTKVTWLRKMITAFCAVNKPLSMKSERFLQKNFMAKTLSEKT